MNTRFLLSALLVAAVGAPFDAAPAADELVVYSGRKEMVLKPVADAFAVLGLEEGSSYQAVTRAFRKKAKELHPDSRDGDRSGEAQLRKLIAAYQYIKTRSEERRVGKECRL